MLKRDILYTRDKLFSVSDICAITSHVCIVFNIVSFLIFSVYFVYDLMINLTPTRPTDLAGHEAADNQADCITPAACCVVSTV